MSEAPHDRQLTQTIGDTPKAKEKFQFQFLFHLELIFGFTL